MPIVTNIILAAITSTITLTNASSYDTDLLSNEKIKKLVLLQNKNKQQLK